MFAAARTTDVVRSLPRPRRRTTSQHFGVRRALGESGWLRLPPAVRARFADEAVAAAYVGTFETVRASCAGRLLASLCRLIGTPVTPHTGVHIPAVVRVFSDGRGGMVWERAYQFPGRRTCIVTSTKRADESGQLLESLPAGLRMPLEVYERDGTLNFVSRGYYFSCLGLAIPIPQFLPPGRTHVVHQDEGDGWFRFSMTVQHRWLGEVYFQTGRFRAAGEAS